MGRHLPGQRDEASRDDGGDEPGGRGRQVGRGHGRRTCVVVFAIVVVVVAYGVVGRGRGGEGRVGRRGVKEGGVYRELLFTSVG